MTLRFALPLLLVWTTGANAAPYREITKGKVSVSCKSSAPAMPDHDFVSSSAEINVTVDLIARRAVVSLNNGMGGSVGPVVFDLRDPGHHSARVLINPSNGWFGIEMAMVDAKTSHVEQFKLHVQRSSDTAPYRVDHFFHDSYNPLHSMGYRGPGPELMKGEKCTVTITGQ
jgi:hypothetical protein